MLMQVRDLPTQLPPVADLADKPDQLLLHGGSAIIAPNGRYVVEPVMDEERIVVAELDLDEIDKERMTLDVSGHYQRDDLFELRFKS